MFRELFAKSVSLVQYKSTSTDYNRRSCEPILLTNRHTCIVIVNSIIYRCMQQSLNQKYVTRFLASRRFSVIFYIAFAILLSPDMRYAHSILHSVRLNAFIYCTMSTQLFAAIHTMYYFHTEASSDTSSSTPLIHVECFR